MSYFPETANDEKKALTQAIRDEAYRLEFDLVGITPAVTPTGFNEFRQWLERGYAGEMQYIPRRKEAYEHPQHVMQRVQSIVMLGLNYRTEEPPSLEGMQGRVSRYAWGSDDYHHLIREKLKRLADFVHARSPGCKTRGVVDTAPLLERDFARLSGLGWFGKNTMLLNKWKGSWFFLAGVLTNLELEYDDSHETDHCGTCTRCLDVCPTNAFPQPYVLDARKCISYLTIELRDEPIPRDLREGMGEWVFGCDLCQEVCPWNRKAPISSVSEFRPVSDLARLDLVGLLQMTEEEFQERFRGTPLERPRRAGLLRNAAIALGNSGYREAVPALEKALQDPEPLIRGAAAWALRQLGEKSSVSALKTRQPIEDNPDVRYEIDMALETIDSRRSGSLTQATG